MRSHYGLGNKQLARLPITDEKEKKMSLMCPMEGCKQKHGMCGHEKMMLVMVILAVVIGLVVFLK